METSRDFEEFFAFLSLNEVRYLVVGGYALAVHANPRFTDDFETHVRSFVQFRVIAAGGHGDLGTTIGDSVVAFALG